MRRLASVAAALISCAACPQAVASDWSWSADAEVATAYVWRGQVANDEAVLQPALSFTNGGFGGSLWGSFDLSDANESRGDLTELDLTLSYGGSSRALEWEVGVVSYLYPAASGDTLEVFAAGSLDLPLAPTLTLFYDLYEIDGLYANLGVGESFELGERTGLDLGAAVGWGNGAYHRGYLEVDEATLADGLASASLAVQLSDRAAFSVNLSYSWFLDSAVRDAARSVCGDDDLLFASVALSLDL